MSGELEGMECEHCCDYAKPFIFDKRGRYVVVASVVESTRELHITIGDRVEDVPICDVFASIKHCPVCGRGLRGSV